MCLLSDSEAVIGKVTPVDKIEKIRVNRQMPAIYCIYLETEIAPIRQYTLRKNTAGKCGLVETIGKQELSKSAARQGTYRPGVR